MEEQSRKDIMELQVNYKSLEGQVIKLTETVERNVSSYADRISKLEAFKNNFWYFLIGIGFAVLGIGGDKLLPIVEKVLPLFTKSIIGS